MYMENRDVTVSLAVQVLCQFKYVKSMNKWLLLMSE